MGGSHKSVKLHIILLSCYITHLATIPQSYDFPKSIRWIFKLKKMKKISKEKILSDFEANTIPKTCISLVSAMISR